MVTGLTQEQKDAFIKERDVYYTTRDDYKSQIKSNQEVIAKTKNMIGELELKINQARPTLEGAEKSMICDRCDTLSMLYQGASPNPDKIFFYNCGMCGYEKTHT